MESLFFADIANECRPTVFQGAAKQPGGGNEAREKGGLILSDAFGGHQLELPYWPIGELLAVYRDRDPKKTAIVDVDEQEFIEFGALNHSVAGIALHFRSLGIGKGDCVLLLSQSCLEKLLLWLGAWWVAAVVCPFNIELNAQHLVSLARVIAPKITLPHKSVDEAIVSGDRRGGASVSVLSTRVRRTQTMSIS